MQNQVVHVVEEFKEVGRNHGGNVTAAQLLTELNAIQDTFKWHLTKQGRIRACLKNDGKRRVFDPITAVAYFRTGEFFPEGRWTEAATTIGLPYEDCAEIVAACNYNWDPSCRQGLLRHDFLRTINVRPSKAVETPARSSSIMDSFARGFRKRSATSTH